MSNKKQTKNKQKTTKNNKKQLNFCSLCVNPNGVMDADSSSAFLIILISLELLSLTLRITFPNCLKFGLRKLMIFSAAE